MDFGHYNELSFYPEEMFMLLGSIFVLSLAAAVGLCLLGGGFGGLQFLWMLPLGFACCFLALLVVAFLFLLLLCAFVDPSKPREKDSPFYRAVAGQYIHLLMVLLRVRVHTEGLEKTPKEGRFLLVSNHLHEADPAVMLRFFPKSQLAFVAKKEAGTMFVVGKIMPMLLCQLINRENDRDALRTIVRCIQILREDKASVAIFPEGGIHDDRKFYPLKPGVFKIALKANVPIVVCSLRNTNHIIKNALRLRPTDVHLHLLEVIPAEALAGKNTVEIAHYVHDLIASDLGPENCAPITEENT